MTRAMSVVLTLSLTGCAGVFNPYVGPKTNSWGSAGTSEPQLITCTELEESLCGALNLAERYRVAYLEAAGNQQKLRSTFAVTGLIAATSTLYYGLEAREKYKDRVARLATIGAASYAAGTFFTSSPRQQVYLDGATAMSCAMIAAAPAMVPKTAKTALSDDLDTLGAALANLESTSKGSSDPATLQAIAMGKSTWQSGTEMFAHLTTSGIVLRARIEVLANEVNHQTLAQLPDLSSLYSLAGSMQTFAQNFGSQSLASATTSTKKQLAGGPTASGHGGAGDAENQLTAVTIATAQVAAHLQFAAIAAQSFSEVAACSPDGIASAFGVTPTDVTVTVEKDKTFSFTVTDKRGHPSAKLSGSNADKVELEPIQIQTGNYVVVVKGKDTTGTSGPTLLISESNGVQAHSVTVLVSDSAQNPQTPLAKTPDKPTTPRNDTIEPAFLKDPLKILSVQCVVGAEADCIMGDKTRAAIHAWKDKQKSDPKNDDSIDANLQSAAAKKDLSPTACTAKPVSCKTTP
jgi:hypothetical protein